MRAFPSATFLSLITLFTWLGGTAVGAEPEACQIADNGVCQGPCAGQEPCAGSDEICGVPCDMGECGPLFTFTAEGIALQRSTTRRQTLVNSIGTVAPSEELLNSKNMNFPVEFGPKVSMIVHNSCGWDIEAGYFQVDGFKSEAFVPGSSLLVYDMTGDGLFSDNTMVRYTSALYSGELNVRRQCNDWFTLLAGYRMMELDEHYGAVGLGANLGTTAVAANAYNRMYGFQLGADAQVYNMGGPLQINGLCKAGIYDNVAGQDTSVVNYGVTAGALNGGRDQAAFVGEVGVVLTYALTKRLAFRGSYEAMWLTGVALAPEQIGATNFSTGLHNINTSGTVFYHGGGMGFEYRF